MADIELVIKIPKYVYDTIVASGGYIADCDNEKVGMAVKNGTPLPKGHGRLKDVDKIIRDGINKGFCEWYDEMKYAPTIIEADKTESEE